MTLPHGFTTRALTLADARAVYDIVAAAEEHDLGESAVDYEDIVGDWQRPSFTVSTDAVGLERDGRLVGYAEVYKGWRADAHVLPADREPGVGEWLADWMVATARRQGGSVMGMPAFEGSWADQLLASLGWFVRWTSWVLELPPGAGIVPQPLPPGYQIGDLVSGDDRYGERAAYRIVDDAFSEWPDRDPSPYGDWAAGVVLRPGFQPGDLRLAVDASGTAVGACFLLVSGDIGYVAQLAVRRDQRGQGLARALLVDAFERARARGATRSELSTDSRTGALGLYERVGMVVTQTWLSRAVTL